MPAKTIKKSKALISPEVLVPRLGEQLVKMELITQAQLNKAARQLNGRPRETLGFETPADRFRACVASTD